MYISMIKIAYLYLIQKSPIEARQNAYTVTRVAKEAAIPPP